MIDKIEIGTQNPYIQVISFAVTLLLAVSNILGWIDISWWLVPIAYYVQFGVLLVSLCFVSIVAIGYVKRFC